MEPQAKQNEIQVCPNQSEIHGTSLDARGPKGLLIQSGSQETSPRDIKGFKKFLGMVNYLVKFSPRLCDMTNPLRRLEDKEVEWCWLEQH